MQLDLLILRCGEAPRFVQGLFGDQGLANVVNKGRVIDAGFELIRELQFFCHLDSKGSYVCTVVFGIWVVCLEEFQKGTNDTACHFLVEFDLFAYSGRWLPKRLWLSVKRSMLSSHTLTWYLVNESVLYPGGECSKGSRVFCAS